jgi:hypothetical protein
VLAALESHEAPLAQDVSLRLRNVEQKRSSLIEAGLLDKSGAPEILSQAELAGQQVRQVIGVYLDDVEQKFSRFDQLFQRASLFKVSAKSFSLRASLFRAKRGLAFEPKTNVKSAFPTCPRESNMSSSCSTNSFLALKTML